jgi:hypothetical protein
MRGLAACNSAVHLLCRAVSAYSQNTKARYGLYFFGNGCFPPENVGLVLST